MCKGKLLTVIKLYEDSEDNRMKESVTSCRVSLNLLTNNSRDNRPETRWPLLKKVHNDYEEKDGLELDDGGDTKYIENLRKLNKLYDVLVKRQKELEREGNMAWDEAKEKYKKVEEALVLVKMNYTYEGRITAYCNKKRISLGSKENASILDEIISEVECIEQVLLRNGSNTSNTNSSGSGNVIDAEMVTNEKEEQTTRIERFSHL